MDILKKLIIILLFGSLASSWGYQEYWDQEVKALCLKDGGVHIYEKVTLSKEDYEKNNGNNGYISIPDYRHAKEHHDYYNKSEQTFIYELNNELSYLDVYRLEFKTYRKSDKKLMSAFISYSRRGGEFLRGLGFHPGSYSCSDIQSLKERYKRKFYQYED
jgi:hypothetical protein